MVDLSIVFIADIVLRNYFAKAERDNEKRSNIKGL